jgi:hypothetical protein
MWIDQCVPTVLNYKGSDVEFASNGTVYQIQALVNPHFQTSNIKSFKYLALFKFVLSLLVHF